MREKIMRTRVVPGKIQIVDVPLAVDHESIVVTPREATELVRLLESSITLAEDVAA